LASTAKATQTAQLSATKDEESCGFVADTDTIEPADMLLLPNEVRIGKSVYVIKRHFTGERDIREAIYAVVKNEAFRAS